MPKKNILHRPFPSLYEAQKWPEYKFLIEEDIPGSEMKLKLSEKQDAFGEFVQKWATQLEEMLTQRLPDHSLPPDFNVPGSSLTTNAQPANTLFAGIQMLLRADVAFKLNEYGPSCFYPDDFSELPVPSQLSYDVELSNIATDLLQTLGKPGVTYLEMKSLGCCFQCGRCNEHRGPMNWRGIIQHYVAQKSIWLSHTSKSSVRSAQDFVYLFTHDTKVESGKPLVRIVNGSDASALNHAYTHGLLCLVCSNVGIYERCPEAYINDHLRDVHLIEEPEKGKHYSS
ncbi:unnamed protein product [Rhizoctonia solani]|uniref:Uncharacterized protein n=1 Tax=Rhizoctonia solani TaxID=456999 RepID=A0A8H2ZZC3_9AGAM|nr:unnamed protein product [Rhizoctonia solani]